MSAEKIQNLTTHKFLTENRKRIESLIKKNAENKNYILEQELSSSQRWKNIDVGMDQSNKIVTWSVLSILGFLLFMLAGWVTRLQIAIWKRNSEGTAAWSQEREREITQRLKAKIDDIVTDAKISIRKIADLENEVLSECKLSDKKAAKEEEKKEVSDEKEKD